MTAVHVDPYWKWAVATGYAHTGAGDKGGNTWVPLLVELVMADDKPNQALALHQQLQNSAFKGFVPAVYRKPGVVYCTAWVARDGISSLPSAFVRRFKLGLAANAVDQPLEPSFESIKESMTGGIKNALSGAACVLAIIDDYVHCDHPAFQTGEGASRIELMWDQADNQSTLTNPPNYGYRKLLKDPRSWCTASNKTAASHGTLVAGIAGGRVTPGFRMRRSSPLLFAGAAQTDAASDAPMAVVMLPNSTVADTSGGALGVNVLDALTFLVNNVDADTHLLVNLSFGTMAGAHDGTGILESALEDLMIKRKGKLTIVLPSGNSFESQCHAQFSLKEKADHWLTWRVLPDDKTCSYLELWLDRDAHISVELQSPDGRQTLTLSTGGNQAVSRQGSTAFAGMWEDPPAPGSAKKRVLIALAPTRCMNDAPCTQHGDWTVQVTNEDNKSIDLVHAWVERDNASFGQRTRGRQSYLVDKDSRRQPSRGFLAASESASGITGFGSLNSIGTFPSATVVSGYNLKSDSVANYSGAGSNGAGHVRAPNYAAPSEESLMLKGLPSVGNAANAVVRLGGTSVATPYATRLIFNQLAANAAYAGGDAVGPALPESTSPLLRVAGLCLEAEQD